MEENRDTNTHTSFDMDPVAHYVIISHISLLSTIWLVCYELYDLFHDVAVMMRVSSHVNCVEEKKK